MTERKAVKPLFERRREEWLNQKTIRGTMITATIKAERMITRIRVRWLEVRVCRELGDIGCETLVIEPPPPEVSVTVDGRVFNGNFQRM